METHRNGFHVWHLCQATGPPFNALQKSRELFLPHFIPNRCVIGCMTFPPLSLCLGWKTWTTNRHRKLPNGGELIDMVNVSNCKCTSVSWTCMGSLLEAWLEPCLMVKWGTYVSAEVFRYQPYYNRPNQQLENHMIQTREIITCSKKTIIRVGHSMQDLKLQS